MSFDYLLRDHLYSEAPGDTQPFIMNPDAYSALFLTHWLLVEFNKMFDK